MIIYVHGCDVPGIGAAITRILFEKNFSIDNIRTIAFEGFFTIMLSVSCKEYQDKSEIEGLIRDSVKNFEVDIKIKHASLPAGKDPEKDEWIPYQINMVCDDQTSVLFYFMKEMAQFKINIANVRCKKLGSEVDKSCQIVSKVEIPINVSIDLLKTTLEEFGRTMNVMIDINPVNSLEL